MNQTRQGFSFHPFKEIRIVRYFVNSKTHQTVLFAFISILLVIIAYVWLISFGTWTSWPPVLDPFSSHSFYDQLATAFEHGQLALDTTPSAALLAVHNPYLPSSRAGISYPIDFSLYHGKYYIYFGPTPALFLMLIKPLIPGEIDDLYLVFAFIAGICIVQSLLIIKIRKHFFQNTPLWMVPCFIVFSSLISPFAWLLTEARVYEASVTGGQFFFLTGLYLIISALEKENISSRRLFLAGISWSFAIGSRLTQVIPIGFVTLMVVLFALRNYRQTKTFSKTLYAFASLALPIIFGLAILGWYNWARFNSIFETGFSYQLAGNLNLQKNKGVLFSPLYILPNLYNYLAMRPKIIEGFPFLQSIPGHGASIFHFIVLPAIYFRQQLTGIFFSMPFLFFAGILIIPFLRKKTNLKSQINQEDGAYLFKWTVISLFGSFVFGFIPIVSFFWVAIRYLMDFLPSLVLLSVVGFWQGYVFLIDRRVGRKLYAAAGIGLMMISVVISTLVMFYAHAQDFQTFNPVLWNELTHLFIR